MAIFDIVLQGEITSETIDSVAGALEEGLGPAALGVIRPDVVAERLRQAGLESSCVSGPCILEIGPLTHAGSLLRARVSQTGQYYAITTELLLARDGSRLGLSETSCDVCTWAEALTAIVENATGLRDLMPGVLVLAVTPESADVHLDGTRVEIEEPLLVGPGVHQVAVSREGVQLDSREVIVESRQTVELDLTAPELEDGERGGGVQRSLRPFLLWGWLTGGFAVATLVPGIVLIAQDGNCKTDSVGCSDTYQTLPAGAVLTVLSGLLVTASVTLHVINLMRRRRHSRIGAGVAITPRGGGFELSASF